MSGKYEYLDDDGVWQGKHPPDRFIGTVRHRGREWQKTEVTARPGHECCPCPACAAWEARCCPNRAPEPGAAPDEAQLSLFGTGEW